MKKNFKNLVSIALEKSGGLHLLYSLIPKRQQATILFYHRVGNNHGGLLDSLPEKTFYHQIRWLRRHFEIVPLAELVTRLQQRRNISGTIAITFDDGYRDNFTVAYPILRAYGIPATIFITTDFIEGEIPWYDRLHLIFHKFYSSQRGTHNFKQESSFDLRHGYQFLKAKLANLPKTKREQFISELATSYGVTDFSALDGLMLTWKQIRELHQNGISIGAHTTSHPELTALSIEEAATEIVASKKIIEEHIGEKVYTFAYPFGQAQNYSLELKTLLKKSGFLCAVTCQIGHVCSGDDLFELKRMYTTEPYLTKFALRLVR